MSVKIFMQIHSWLLVLVPANWQTEYQTNPINHKASLAEVKIGNCLTGIYAAKKKVTHSKLALN